MSHSQCVNSSRSSFLPGRRGSSSSRSAMISSGCMCSCFAVRGAIRMSSASRCETIFARTRSSSTPRRSSRRSGVIRSLRGDSIAAMAFLCARRLQASAVNGMPTVFSRRKSLAEGPRTAILDPLHETGHYRGTPMNPVMQAPPLLSMLQSLIKTPSVSCTTRRSIRAISPSSTNSRRGSSRSVSRPRCSRCRTRRARRI